MPVVPIPLIEAAPTPTQSKDTFPATANNFYVDIYTMVFYIDQFTAYHLTALPIPPALQDSDFANKADAFLAALPNLVTEVNDLIDSIGLSCSHVTTLPAIPSRGADPTNFATEAVTFLAAMPTFRTELNAFINALNAYVPSSYSETATLGQTTDDGSAYALGGGDFKSAYSITVPSGGMYFKHVVLRMQQVSSGAHIRPVIYSGVSSSSTIVATGQDVALSAQAFNNGGVDVTINFRSDGAATFLAAGIYGLCIHASGTTIDVKSVAAGSILWNADTYSDGPSNPYGSTSTSSRTPRINIPYSVTGP